MSGIQDYYKPDDTLTEDQKRVAALVLVVDGIYDFDLHELAGESAVARGDEEADERDYYNAACKALDALRAESEGESL